MNRRHGGEEKLHLFLDTDALAAGDLGVRIREALARSRNLVVLIDLSTRDSPWVRLEMETWLEQGGSAERLFLVRTDPRVDLSWDAGTFLYPDTLPAPLRGLFASEQKWFDVLSTKPRAGQANLAGLYAAITDADPATLLMEETRILRDQRWRSRLITSLLSGLLVVALVAGGVAVRMSVASDASAREARSQAAAASALLVLPYSYTNAIEEVLTAAEGTESQSVRSAMLAVAGATGPLRRTVDYGAVGTSPEPTGMAFSADSERLVAWGQAADPDKSHLVSWSIASGRRIVDGDVAVKGIGDVLDGGMARILACGDKGPVYIDRASLAVTPVWAVGDRRSGEGGECEVTSFDGGAILSVGYPEFDLPSAVIMVPSSGEPALIIDDGWVPRTNRRSWSVPVVVGDELRLVSSRGVASIRMAGGISVEQVTVDGHVLVKNSTKGYALVTHSPNGKSASVARLPVPPDTVSVALYGDLSQLVNQAVWITKKGDVGLVGSSARLRLEPGVDPLGAPAALTAKSYASQIVTAGDSTLIANAGGKAYFVEAPTRYVHGFSAKPIDPDFGSEGRNGAPFILNSCDNGEAVELPGGYFVVAGPASSPKTIKATSDSASLRECAVVDPGPPLMVNGVRVTDSVIDGDVLVSPDQTLVALFRPGLATEILNVGGQVEQAWRTFSQDARIAAMGERRVIATGTPAWSQSVLDGSVEPLGERGPTLKLIRPDGLGGLALASAAAGKQSKVLEVDRASTAELPTGCQHARLGYLPRIGFQDSADAAGAQSLVASQDTNSFVDCKGGTPFAWDAQVNVNDYQIGTQTGRIIWNRRDGDSTVSYYVTVWRPGSQDKPETRDLPVPRDTTEQLKTDIYLDNGNNHLIVVRSDESLIHTYHWQNGAWVADRVIESSIGGVLHAAYTPDLGLVIAVGSTGAFEVSDVLTGRRLATDSSGLKLERGAARDIEVIEVDGFMYAYVGVGDDGSPLSSRGSNSRLA